MVASPFVRGASVDKWSELPDLLNRLLNEPPDAIAKLQVRKNNESVRYSPTILCFVAPSSMQFSMMYPIIEPFNGACMAPRGREWTLKCYFRNQWSIHDSVARYFFGRIEYQFDIGP